MSIQDSWGLRLSTRNKQFSRNQQGRKFDNILLESIDESLSSLGESAKTSIYFHLQQGFFISKHEIPFRIDDFSNALERIFGLGARHLELLIMKKLHEKVSCQYKWKGPKWLVPDLTLRKYVELARLGYENNGKVGEIEVLINVGEQKEQYI